LIFFCFFSSIKRRKEGLRPPAKFSPSRFGYIPYPANFAGRRTGLFRAISSGNWPKKFCGGRFPEEMSRKSFVAGDFLRKWAEKFVASDFLRK